MDDDTPRCAICGTEENSTTDLTGAKLLTNIPERPPPCGHRFCARCVERRTFGQKQFACPVEGCAAIVRQRTLHERKTWDDHLFEKGVDWRARVVKVYNKTQADFASLAEYNDYLEEVEDIVFNLLHARTDEDRERELRKVAAYEAAHKHAINANLARRNEADRAAQREIDAERDARDARRRELLEDKERATRDRREARQKTVEDELAGRAEPALNAVALQQQLHQAELQRVQQLTEPQLRIVLRSGRIPPKPARLEPQPERVRGDPASVRKASGFDEGLRAERDWKEAVAGLARLGLTVPG